MLLRIDLQDLLDEYYPLKKIPSEECAVDGNTYCGPNDHLGNYFNN